MKRMFFAQVVSWFQIRETQRFYVVYCEVIQTRWVQQQWVAPKPRVSNCMHGIPFKFISCYCCSSFINFKKNWKNSVVHLVQLKESKKKVGNDFKSFFPGEGGGVIKLRGLWCLFLIFFNYVVSFADLTSETTQPPTLSSTRADAPSNTTSPRIFRTTPNKHTNDHTPPPLIKHTHS